MLELCGLPLPNRKLDSHSLLPILRNPSGPSRHDVLHWQWQDRWAVRQGDWKLIDDKHLGDERVFLASLADEEPERKNYVAEKPDVVRRLRRLHDEWLVDVTPR